METFSVGPYVLELLPSGDDCLLSVRSYESLPSVPGARHFFSREEAAHLAGVLVHCVLQRAAPASAVKAFREMTIGELLDARAFPGRIPIEEGEPEQPGSPDLPPFPPGV